MLEKRLNLCFVIVLFQSIFIVIHTCTKRVYSTALVNVFLNMLGNVVPGAACQQEPEELHELKQYIVPCTKDCTYTEIVDGHEYISEDFYASNIIPIVHTYDPLPTQDTLANTLAWRDFNKDHLEQEIEKMAKKHPCLPRFLLHHYTMYTQMY